jgi:hypothetical protein
MRRMCILAVLMVVYVAMSGTHAAAQCRSGWINGGCITFPSFPLGGGVFCSVELCYCYTGPGLTPRSYEIYSVKFGTGCVVQTPTGSLMRSFAQALVTANPAGFPCPSCPTASPQINTQWAGCVKFDSTQDSWIPCPGAEGACLDAYTICCNPDGSRTVTFLWHSTTADCTDPTCQPVCPP